MSNEMTKIEKEISVQKQQLVIEKNKLLIEELKSTGGIPKSLIAKNALADQFAKSKLVPDCYRGRPEDIFIALSYGELLGFQNSLSCLFNIYVVKGKPSPSSDSMIGAAFCHPDFIDYDQTIIVKGSFTYKGKTYQNYQSTTTIKRKINGRDHVFSRSHSVEMSKDKLDSFPEWKNDPENMVKHRSDAKACRSAFPEILSGFYTREEAIFEDYVDNENDKLDENVKSQASQVIDQAPEAPETPDTPDTPDTTEEQKTQKKKEKPEQQEADWMNV